MMSWIKGLLDRWNKKRYPLWLMCDCGAQTLVVWESGKEFSPVCSGCGRKVEEPR